MHYYIDGYNLFFREFKEKGSLEEGRERIIAALLQVKLPLTIVFDGRGDPLSERTHKGPLEIVYTAKGQSADIYIIDEISWVKNPKEHTVVTSDKRLSDSCRHAGACCQTINAFLAFVKKKQSVKAKEEPPKDTDKNLQRLLKIFTELLERDS